MKFFSIPSKIQPVLFSLLLLTSIFILLFFPVRTTSSIWKGYRVLSCDLELEEIYVTNLLDSVGIKDYVSQSRSILKSTNTFIPVHPLIEKANKNRVNWFINSEYNLRYFYIPDSAILQTKIEKAFSNTSSFWNLEQSVGFTYIPILLTLFLIFISFAIPGNRFKRFMLVLPSVLLSWSLNTFFGYGAAISSTLFITFWGLLLPHNKIELLPMQKAQRIRNHPELIVMALFIVVFSVIGGWSSIILTFLSLVSSVSIGMIFKLIYLRRNSNQAKKRLHQKFIPLAMHPHTIKALHSKNFFIVSGLIFLLFILIGSLFIMQETKSPVALHKTIPQELCIPSPSGYNDHAEFTVSGFRKSRKSKDSTNLPDLGDYISLQWQLETAPWVKIGEIKQDPDEGSFVEMFEYTIQENGILISSVTGNITFDNSFISGVLNSKLTPLEKMLQKQGRFVSAHIMGSQ